MKTFLICLMLIFMISTSSYAQMTVTTVQEKEPVHVSEPKNATSPVLVPVPVAVSALKISGSTTVPANSLVILNLSGASPTASVIWDTWPDVPQYTNGLYLVFTGSPGQYGVVGTVLDSGTLSKVKTTVTITAPDPPKIAAIAIFDPQSLTSLPAGQVDIYQSETIESELAAKGIIYLQYDMNDKIKIKGRSHSIMNTNWYQEAVKIGLPALVVSTASGVKATPLPADQASMTSYLGLIK